MAFIQSLNIETCVIGKQNTLYQSILFYVNAMGNIFVLRSDD